MLELVRISEKYLPALINAVDEYKADQNPYRVADINALIEAADSNDVLSWIEKKQDEDKGINLKPGYVACTYYLLMEDEEYIASFQLRHKLTERLMSIGGHIAYIVRPSKRQKGYAFAGLRLVLSEAKKMGIDRVLITCNAKNDASFAVIMKAKNTYGGEILPDIAIDGGFERRVWVNTVEDKSHTL